MAWWKRWFPEEKKGVEEVEAVLRPRILGLDAIALEDGCLRLEEERFPVSEIFLVSVNRPPVEKDGVGGSCVLRRRRFGGHGVPEVEICRVTFAPAAWPVVERVIEAVAGQGGTITRAEVLDISFRKAFF